MSQAILYASHIHKMLPLPLKAIVKELICNLESRNESLSNLQ